VEEYNDALVERALVAELRDRGLTVRREPLYRVVAAAAPQPCPVCRTTEVLWPPRAGAGPADATGKPIEKPSNSRSNSGEVTEPDSLVPARIAYLTAGREGRRAGIRGGLECRRLKYWGECWHPPMFGVLLRLPGVRAAKETARTLSVKVAPEALRAVVEMLGFRAPARTVAWLEATRRRAVLTADRRRERARRSAA
jgi:hypothetical protein